MVSFYQSDQTPSAFAQVRTRKNGLLETNAFLSSNDIKRVCHQAGSHTYTVGDTTSGVIRLAECHPKIRMCHQILSRV